MFESSSQHDRHRQERKKKSINIELVQSIEFSKLILPNKSNISSSISGQIVKTNVNKMRVFHYNNEHQSESRYYTDDMNLNKL